ncbi:hypothetical protein EBR25_05200 [bacterium]|nr:hypothetical protein [bacterium]
MRHLSFFRIELLYSLAIIEPHFCYSHFALFAFRAPRMTCLLFTNLIRSEHRHQYPSDALLFWEAVSTEKEYYPASLS